MTNVFVSWWTGSSSWKQKAQAKVQLLTERRYRQTSLAVWGGHGNESQHSFYQFLREGTAKNAIDVFWFEKPGHAHNELHRVLMANAKAQTEALVTRDPKSKYFNVVSTVSIEELTPETLGALMAMYEHKTTMLGTLFGINAFDQLGVKLGKKLANEAYKTIACCD